MSNTPATAETRLLTRRITEITKTRFRQVLAFCLVLLCAVVATAGAKKKRTSQPQALVSGTVFQKSGRLLPGAKVTVVDEEGKPKRVRSITDRRGEFAIRVPAGRARYRVTAQAKGFQSQEKTVEIYESEKVTVNFQLPPNQKATAKQD